MSNRTHRTHECTAERGSMLLEILVAFALISTTLIVVIDSFLTLQKNYRATLVQKEVTDAVALVLEDMTRETRISNQFSYSGGVFSVIHRDGLNGQAPDPIFYRLSGTELQKKITAGGTYIPLTPPSVEVTTFTVTVYSGSSQPSRVLVSISAKPKAANTGVDPVYLQTTFTSRN